MTYDIEYTNVFAQDVSGEFTGTREELLAFIARLEEDGSTDIAAYGEPGEEPVW